MNMYKYNFNIDQLADNEENDSLLSKNSYIDKSIKDELKDSNMIPLCKVLMPKLKDTWDWDNLIKKNESESTYEISLPSLLYAEELYFQRAESSCSVKDTTKYAFKASDFIYSKLSVHCCPGVKAIGESVVKYIDSIITKGDLNICDKYPLGVSGWNDNENHHHNPFWMSYLKRYVPVMLVPPELMPEPPFDKKYDKCIELLGCYFPLKDIGPMIYLCPKRIEACVTKNLSKTVLYALVLIHEFAHAMMDETNILCENKEENIVCSKAHPIKELEIDELYMEEALANMITLQYFENESSCIKDAVRSFMKEQPAPYQFGIQLYDTNDKQIDWREWRKYKAQSTLTAWRGFVDKSIMDGEEMNAITIISQFKDALSRKKN